MSKKKNSFVSNKQRRYVMANLNKNTNYKDYIYGDYDRDGTPNIDDRYPLNPNKKERVNEVLISEELKKIENKNESYRKDAEKIAENEGGKYRVKHPYSTVNSLRRNYQGKMHDLGAVRVIVADKPALDRRVKKLRNKYDVIREKDFYKDPKGGYYHAHHFVIRGDDGKPIEIQVRTKRMHKIFTQTHEGYKRGWKMDKDKIRRRVEKNKRLDEHG